MATVKGNSEFCFPETLNVIQGEASAPEGNIEVELGSFDSRHVTLLLQLKNVFESRGITIIILTAITSTNCDFSMGFFMLMSLWGGAEWG